MAVGSAALVVADLGFLRAFGPGMALAVLVGLVVTVTFLPAALAPRRPRAALARPAAGDVARRAQHRLDGPADRHGGTRAAADDGRLPALLAVMAERARLAGSGQPADPRAAARERAASGLRAARRGFAPGTVSPATLVVTAPGIAREREALADFQTVLSAQPGVAGVIGPATNPTRQPFGW